MTTPDPATLREALETAMGGYDVALSDFTGPHMPRIWAAARWALDLIEEIESGKVRIIHKGEWE